MKISTAFREAFRVCFGRFGTTLRFLTAEGCMTLAALAPLLFLTNDGLKWLALLAVPFWLALMLWARVNAAAGMRDALNGGSLFGYVLADPSGYGKKLLFGLKRGLFLLLWGAPLIACLIIARIHIAGEMDGFTLLRMIKSFGGGDLMNGIIYLALILIAAILLLAFGCAFHSGDRHAFVRDNPKLLKGHRGKVTLCWLCALISLLPLLVALGMVIARYIPVLENLTAVISKTYSVPPVKPALIMIGAGMLLTLPLLPLRSLITAAYINGLAKEKGESHADETGPVAGDHFDRQPQ